MSDAPATHGIGRREAALRAAAGALQRVAARYRGGIVAASGPTAPAGTGAPAGAAVALGCADGPIAKRRAAYPASRSRWRTAAGRGDYLSAAAKAARPEIERYLVDRGVTRCPTAFAAPSPQSDRREPEAPLPPVSHNFGTGRLRRLPA